ncbi:hypothetical protein LTR64_006626 [Lithohypha guttulata]|uniref:uncharacterized protein n=1 Tax=Lithohypha guttulata TaxID=1690604 RepID=UPI002DDDE5B1|nr:hypothetical protein LTR51_004815 [Lithohypha guttulata]
MSGNGPGSADDEESSSSEAHSSTAQTQPGRSGTGQRQVRALRGGSHTSSQARGQHGSSGRLAPGVTGRGSKTPTGHPPSILPPEKVFPVQIGSELFRLSGASISSDAPSYFTQFFEEQIRQNEQSGGHVIFKVKAVCIYIELQLTLLGYYVKPRDGGHFVKLFADAQFYSLPRLIDQLFESEIFIQIGEQHFQIPKDLFSDPGNSPNFFSLGFAVFFSTPGEVFPGVDRRGLLRPPSITPPYVPGRSAATFAQLLHLLRGYPLPITNEVHREELLRDCRYFHLRGLEQRIIAHDISYNLERQQSEICLRIEDIKPSGISYKADNAENEQDVKGGWVQYARPFVDDDLNELVVEIGGETTVLDIDDMRLDFHGLSKARVSSLIQVVANKMNLPTNAPLGAMLLQGGEGPARASPGHTPLSQDRIKVRFERATDISLDGARYEIDRASPLLGQDMSHGRGRLDDTSEDSDAMSEDVSNVSVSLQHFRQESVQNPQLQPEPDRTRASTQTRGASQAGLELGTNTSRKRKRHTIPPPSQVNTNGKWVIRCGQWRLRVQQSERDPVRGGYEIIFIAVKIDAFSEERARNVRRKFLGGGG